MSDLKIFLDNLSADQLSKRLELALEGANLGIWDWDLRDNSVNFDRRWCEMIGLEHEKTPMLLSTWESRVHPDDLPHCYADVKRYLNGETAYYENIHRIKHANGEWRYILDRGRLSGWDESGKPIRFTGTHLDVTTTQQARRMLEARKNILAELVQEMPAAVAMFDRELKYLAFSKKWLSDYGLTGQDLTGRSHYDVFPEIQENWKELHRRALKGESLKCDRDEFKRPGKRSIWLRWSIEPWRSPTGDIGGIVMLTEDITREVETSAALAQSAKLVALGEMASGIAHEINNPLAIIAGKLQVLQLRLGEAGVKNAEIDREVTICLDTVYRMSKIISGMRKLSHAALSPDQTSANLKTIVLETLEFCRGQFTTQNIDVRLNLSDATVVCSHVQISQIILNLLNNSIDALKQESEKWVEIRLENHQEDQAVCLSVIDSGPGIGSGIEAKIFDPFFTTKPPGEGTGLGLSISRTLAMSNNATLKLNTNGRHTRFDLIFPL